MSLTSKKIQGRPTKPLSVEETAEKVRALHEKQSMWMKERETEKSSLGAKTRKDSKNSSGNFGPEVSSESSKFNGRTTSSRSLSSSESRHSEGKSPYSNPRRKPLYPEPKRDHSDMISWIAKGPAPFSRNKRPPSVSGHHNRHNSTSKTLSKEVTRNSTGKNASLSSKEYKASNYSISQQSSLELAAQSQELHNKQRPWSRSSSGVEGKVENTTEQEEDIPKNGGDCEGVTHQPVKNNLASLQTAHISPEMLAALTDTLAQRLQGTIPGSQTKTSFLAPGKSQGHGPTKQLGMASHFCALCDELMTAPRHTPMAVIPCGHSFCKACLRDCRKCPTCQTKVNSTAVNTVLQAIIVDFNAQKEKERLQRLEEQTRKYVDEYQSLCMRHSALTAEAENILETMENSTELLMEEKKKAKKLGMDKQSLREKIQELQEHLEKIALEEEKCQRRCEELELNYNEEKGRLAMVEDTVKMINKSTERVKMLVQNFAPSLSLDEMFKE